MRVPGGAPASPGPPVRIRPPSPAASPGPAAGRRRREPPGWASGRATIGSPGRPWKKSGGRRYIRLPCRHTVLEIPPTSPLSSRMTISYPAPRRSSSKAAVRPAGPAPMMTILSTKRPLSTGFRPTSALVFVICHKNLFYYRELPLKSPAKGRKSPAFSYFWRSCQKPALFFIIPGNSRLP